MDAQGPRLLPLAVRVRCIVARSVRFGRPGRTDLIVHMQPGDVCCFNAMVWHSGLLNATYSSMIVMCFGKTRYAVNPEGLQDPAADPSTYRFSRTADAQSPLGWEAGNLFLLEIGSTDFLSIHTQH